MNSNQPTPNPSGPGNAAEMNDAIARKLNTLRWTGRALTGLALAVGLLSIVAAVLLAWANSNMVMPMERLLFQDYPAAVKQTGTNAVPANQAGSKPPLTRDELDLRHVQVTLVHGKELFVTCLAIALLGTGTFLTLLLVIFNRRVTLRQINASLAQISQQIKQLQDGKRP